jgi:mannitol-1-/sugar-/sorbitol-6-phosphatase
MPPLFKALIFDLDGTLVDSSEVVRKVMEAWCLKHNILLQSVLNVCHGGRTEDTVSLVAPHLCAKSEAADIEHLESTTLDGLMPISGADRFLDDLVSHSWAIVTSSSMLTAKPKLEACRMPIPPVFITAESVDYGKPHPEPFLKAARELEIEPAECLVFEDADNGVNSALAAGCLVVIIGDSCKIQNGNIVCRSPDFTRLNLSDEGDLKLNDDIIAILKKEAKPVRPANAAKLCRR